MMDDEERVQFARSLGRACATHSGPSLDAALAELGWHEALSVDPRAAVSLLFELKGAANATASTLEAVLGSAVGLTTRSSAGCVLPSLGHGRAPGEIVGGGLFVRGVASAPLSEQTTATVVAATDQHDHLLVESPTAGLALRPIGGIDPCLGLVEVTGDGVPFTVRAQLDPAAWPAAVAVARLAVSHELVGAGRAMLGLARHHALERVQFGRPISTFQAVRHRMADTLIAIEAAVAGLDSAWEEPSPQTAAMAKALAGRSARTAARHCQQVLAGIGFTTEHDLHRHLRRVMVLDELFGTARTLTRELGNEVLATRRLPALPSL